MNIPVLRWILVAACLMVIAVAAAGSYEDEYEDEEPAAPPPSPIKVRPSPFARQARGPIVPGRPSPKNAVTQKTTTTTTEAPAEYEDEEGEGEEVAGNDEDQQSTTSEAPKRSGVRSGGVRPFRSNADLLETLKKRRQQHVSGQNSAPSTITTTTSAPSNQEKGFKGGRRAGKLSSSAFDQTGSNSERKATFNRNSRQKSAAPSTSEPAVEQAEEQPRTRGFRSRKF